MTPPQPAMKSYFFGKGYNDMLATIRESWSLNQNSIEDFFDKAKREHSKGGFNYLSMVFWGASGVAVFIFGTLTFVAASSVHIVVLGVFLAIFFVTFSILYLVERMVMATYKIFVACPECHSKHELPAYACPACPAKHTRLIPGPYGIFSRKCQCGESLWTSFLTGRTRYQAFCPDCKKPLENAESTPICIPVMGTPGSGKSCLIYSAVESLIHRTGPANKWTVAVADEKTRFELESLRSKVQAGGYPHKTQGGDAMAFRIAVKTSGAFQRVLQLYDCAGEIFSRGTALDAHHYYGYSRGFVTVIDCESLVNKPGFQTTIEKSYDHTINQFEGNHDIARGDVIKRPHLVVLNKIDSPAVSQALGKLDAMSSAEREARCREFLKAKGLGHFMSVLESKFPKIRYFPASTLKIVNGRLEPQGLDPAISWLLSEIDSSFSPRPSQSDAAATAGK